MIGWSLVLLAAAVVACGLGAWRSWAWRRAYPERPLSRLLGFFVLLAASQAVQALQSWRLEAVLEAGALPRDQWDLLDALFWLHHLLLSGALALALSAYLPKGPTAGPAAALAPVLAWSEPILRMLESLGFLALTLLAARNHSRRQNLGSLQVAAGFFLLAAAQAVFLYDHAALGLRRAGGEGLLAVGTLLLALAMPRRRGWRG